MKILISAYACSPYQGSEAGVGWNFIYGLAQHHLLTVFVEEEKFKSDITDWLARDKNSHMQKVDFIFIKKKRNRRLRKIWPPSYYYYYKKWHQSVYDYVRKNLIIEDYDLTHQLTMVGFREPGFLWKLEIPFVWGPVGGGGYFPMKFLPSLGKRGFFFYLAYNIINYLHAKYLRRPKFAAKIADSGFIAATKENSVFFEKHWKSKSVIIPEVGLYIETIPQSHLRISLNKKHQVINVVWCGQLIPRKGLIHALDAICLLKKRNRVHLHIVGGGELHKDLQRYSRDLGLASIVTFHGEVARSDAVKLMKECDIALITSLRDLTSTVLLEYLSVGKPVIAPRHCGFVDILDDSCGYLIPLKSPMQFSRTIANILDKIVDDPKELYGKSISAKQKAEEHNWQNKIAYLNDIYSERTKRNQ